MQSTRIIPKIRRSRSDGRTLQIGRYRVVTGQMGVDRCVTHSKFDGRPISID